MRAVAPLFLVPKKVISGPSDPAAIPARPGAAPSRNRPAAGALSAAMPVLDDPTGRSAELHRELAEVVAAVTEWRLAAVVRRLEAQAVREESERLRAATRLLVEASRGVR
jgi:hypothetical protein